MRNNAAARCVKCGMRKISPVTIHPAADCADCARNRVKAHQLCEVQFKLFVSHFLML